MLIRYYFYRANTYNNRESAKGNWLYLYMRSYYSILVSIPTNEERKKKTSSALTKKKLIKHKKLTVEQTDENHSKNSAF